MIPEYLRIAKQAVEKRQANEINENNELSLTLNSYNSFNSCLSVCGNEQSTERKHNEINEKRQTKEEAPKYPQAHEINEINEQRVGSFPFAGTLTALERRCPDYVDEGRWQQCIDDARRFLPEWGNQADALGWTARELFGLHRPPAKPHPSYDRLSRYDETGMLWGLDGRRVIALSSNTAAVETGTGNTLTYRKLHKPALGPFGDSLDDFK